MLIDPSPQCTIGVGVVLRASCKAGDHEIELYIELDLYILVLVMR